MRACPRPSPPPLHTSGRTTEYSVTTQEKMVSTKQSISYSRQRCTLISVGTQVDACLWTISSVYPPLAPAPAFSPPPRPPSLPPAHPIGSLSAPISLPAVGYPPLLRITHTLSEIAPGVGQNLSDLPSARKSVFRYLSSRLLLLFSQAVSRMK